MSALDVAAHAWARLGGASVVRARSRARLAGERADQADQAGHGAHDGRAEHVERAERDELAVLAALGLPDPQQLDSLDELRGELARTQCALELLAGELADTAAVLHLALSLVESQPALLEAGRRIVRQAEGDVPGGCAGGGGALQ